MLDQYHQDQIVGAATYAMAQAKDILLETWTRPFLLYRPTLKRDGNMWCALYGENIQEGIAGFGTSPNAAASAFDAEWFKGEA